MTLTLFFILYAIPALIAWRLVGGHFAWATAYEYNQDRPDTGDWVMGGVLGGFLAGALIWPLLLLGWGLKVSVPIAWRGFMKVWGKVPSAPAPAIGAEARAQREGRI